jgi:hypothetical protein
MPCLRGLKLLEENQSRPVFQGPFPGEPIFPHRPAPEKLIREVAMNYPLLVVLKYESCL